MGQSVQFMMEEPRPIPLPQPVQETSSFECLDAIVSLSHQKIHYPVPLRKPLETVVWPDSFIASQVTSTSRGPGPPNTCTEVANSDDSTQSSHVPSTIDGHTNNPGDQDEENECSLSDELDDYNSDPDFQDCVPEVN